MGMRSIINSVSSTNYKKEGKDMLLTKKKRNKIQKDLAVLSELAGENQGINLTKAICEICVICNLDVNKVFVQTVQQPKSELFVDVETAPKKKAKATKSTTKTTTKPKEDK